MKLLIWYAAGGLFVTLMMMVVWATGWKLPFSLSLDKVLPFLATVSLAAFSVEWTKRYPLTVAVWLYAVVMVPLSLALWALLIFHVAGRIASHLK